MSFISFLKGLCFKKKCTCCDSDSFIIDSNIEPEDFNIPKVSQSNVDECEKVNVGDKVANMTNFSEMLDEVKPDSLLSVTVTTEIVEEKPKKKIVKKKAVKKKPIKDKTEVKPKVKSNKKDENKK